MTLNKIVATPNSVTIVPLTAEEIAQYEADMVYSTTIKAAETVAAEQAATDKAALLAKLGITADEAKLLLS